MATLFNWFFRQLVQESNLDDAFANLEDADHKIISDLGLFGVYVGLTVSQSSPTALTVDIAAGTAYDQNGKRIRVPSGQTNVDVSKDYLGADTAVAGGTNAKWLSLYLVFDRELSNPQTDGNGDQVYATEAESYRWKVVQGTEALSPTKPGLLTDAILLCDIQLVHNQTAIVTGDLDTNRRMNLFKRSGSPLAINHTTFLAVLGAIQDIINVHIGGSGQNHGAADINYAGSPLWADGVTSIPNTGTVEDGLDAIVTQLAKVTAVSGDDVVGVRQDASVSPTLSSGTMRQRLVALRLLSNLFYAGSPTWADSTSISAGTGEAAIDAIVTALAGSAGLAKVSGATIAQSPDSLTGAAGQSMLAALLTLVNARARKGSAETITGAWVHDDVTISGTAKVKLASRSITRVLSCPPVPDANGGSPTWQVANLVAVTTIAGSESLFYWPSLPHASVLNSIGVVLKGAGSHGGLPSVMPTVKLWRIATNGTVTQIGSTATDSSANLTIYEDYHLVSVTGLTHTVDRTGYVYVLEVVGEQSTNALAGLISAMPTATWTATSMDDGAS